MTTTHPAHDWPTPLLLPGQAASPPGPVDLTMMYVLHAAFRRDLAAFADAAIHTPIEDRDAWARLAERWDLFAELLHHHHAGEDAGLWPLLRDRTDDQGRQVLAEMEAEHAEIDPILAASATGLTRLASTADEDARAALVVRLIAAKESLARHLGHEERDAIALVQQLLTPEDWRGLDEEFFAVKHLPFRTVLKLVPWVMYELPAPVQQRVVSTAPAALRLVWRLTRAGFARRERRTFAHCTA